MSRYEERLQRDLANLKMHLGKLIQEVEGAVRDAAGALLSGDHGMAYTVILSALPVNRARRELDQLCHSFIAVHLPSAGHLRFVSALMRVNLELERIGDYAATVCRESVQLGARPAGTLARDLEALAEVASQILQQADAAFVADDAEQARATMGMSDRVSAAFTTAHRHLLAEGGSVERRDILAYLAICNALRRVGRQAKNICEEAVFAATGEMKAAKVYRILFLDEDNSSLGPLAQAVARQGYPLSGEYDTAGRGAAEQLDAGLVGFLGERGIDIGMVAPTTLDLNDHHLADYHVIVGLQGAVASYVENVPYHTIVQEWSVGDPPGDEQARLDYETVYRDVAYRVRELMPALRGEDAP